MLGVMLFIAARFAVLRSVVKVQKKQFRQTALMQQKNELKQLAFLPEDLYKDAKGLEWKENNKEIVLDGKYHEVISIEKKNGSYIVSIIEDRKENELFRNFFEKTDKNGHLADCILLVVGMNFTASPQFEFKQQPIVFIEHQTRYTLKSGIEISARTERPPARTLHFKS
jgi:hypothetical protein